MAKVDDFAGDNRVDPNAAGNEYSSWKQARERMVDEVWPAMTPSFQLIPGTKIFTIGSCFARNIEEHLQRLGFRIPTLDFRVPQEESRRLANGILNKYTPASIFQEIDWAKRILRKGGKITEEDSMPFLYERRDGSCIDTSVGGFVPVTRERFFQRRRQIYDTFKEAFSADCVVMTLGLIEAWFDREKGVYIHQAPVAKDFAQHGGRFGFERLTYEQCRRFVQDSIDAVRDFNKDAKFLITTSPVPLVRTFTCDDVIVANMYSKSLLRAVAGEIAAANKQVDYFPSYENVMLTKSWDVWEADLRHVSDLFVGKVVGRLMDTYCSGVEEARKLFHRSYTDLKDEALVGALELGRRAVELAPENGEFRRRLGELLARKGDLKEAEAQFVRAISLKPGDAALHHQLADALARQGRFEEAIKEARWSVELAPENEEFHKQLGRLWGRKWRLGRATVHLALAAVYHRLQRKKRPWLKGFLRFLLPVLQRLSGRQAVGANRPTMPRDDGRESAKHSP